METFRWKEKIAFHYMLKESSSRVTSRLKSKDEEVSHVQSRVCFVRSKDLLMVRGVWTHGGMFSEIVSQGR